MNTLEDLEPSLLSTLERQLASDRQILKRHREDLAADRLTLNQSQEILTRLNRLGTELETERTLLINERAKLKGFKIRWICGTLTGLAIAPTVAALLIFA